MRASRPTPGLPCSRPRGPPPAIIARLYQAVETALAKDWVRTNLAKQGIPVVLTTHAQVAAMLPAEVKKWAGVIKAAHIMAG